MDYAEHLSREHSRASIDAIAKAVGNDPKEFKKIIDIIFNSPAPLPHRASWLLAVISRSHPELLRPYVRKLINALPEMKIGGIKRNIIGALGTQKIPSDLQGKIISLCFDLILSPDEPVAVKVLSLEIIFPLTKNYPELKQELKSVIEDQLPKTTAAFHSRGNKILRQLHKN